MAIRLVNNRGAEKILPETIIFRDVPLDINVPITSLAGRDGGVRIGRSTILPRTFELKGRIYYPDRAKIRQVFDELLPFLMQAPLDVWRLAEVNRYLRAHPQGAPHSWIDLGKELEVNITMLALDPYWYGDKEAVPVSGTGTIYTYGNAPVYPIIKTTGSAVNLQVTHAKTGKTIKVTGTGIVEVDCADLVVKIDGVNSLDKVNDEFKLGLFELVAGENTITTSHPITVSFRHRWY